MILTRPKILIVDDQPSNLKAYSKLLADFDADIITALSGNEALQLAIIHTFSLVLMDVQMPDMDGYETAGLLLNIENNQHVPIIFITAAYKDSGHQIKGYRCGAVDYLEKPVDDMILLSKVKVFLTLDDQKATLKVQNERLKKEVTSRLVVSDSYKKLIDAVEQNFDDVADFPNRVLALDRMRQATILTQAKDQITTILFIDVDNFKHINDSLGQLKGNQVLAEVAARLAGCVQRDDTVARFGGDQFLILLPNMSEVEQIEAFCQKILTSVSQAISIEGALVFISTSIGITQSPTDGSDPHVLIQNAEAAMYRSKKEGGNAFHFFTTSMNTESLQRFTMENKLREAIENESLEVYYQPLIDIKSQSLIGAEALLRWADDELGFISPETFIPIVESMGMINSVGEWVLSTATQQAQRWQQKFTVPFQIAVNFSAKQFINKDIAHTIEKILKSSKLAPSDLEVEITEQLLMLDKHDVKSRLREIAELGVSLSLDDFGTGYSSLSYLKKFPVKIVKIDRSFIQEVTTDPEDAILTKTIITMAHSLKMKVIAEGVETKEQLDFLSRHGCNVAQGYYFSKPVPAEQFEALFEQFSGNGKNDKFNNA